jgi:hypothetical protein
MNRRQDYNISAFSNPPLLITESADEFAALRAELEAEIKPSGIVERLYVDDFAVIIWETQRLRRCKTAIINRAFRPALHSLILKVITPRPEPVSLTLMRVDISVPPEEVARQRKADDLTDAWFTDDKAKQQVAALLQKFNFDLIDVEASAIKDVSAELEVLDRMLTSLESRRNRTLACIAAYRQSLAQQLRQSSDQMLERNGVRRLEYAGKKSKTA